MLGRPQLLLQAVAAGAAVPRRWSRRRAVIRFVAAYSRLGAAYSSAATEGTGNANERGSNVCAIKGSFAAKSKQSKSKLPRQVNSGDTINMRCWQPLPPKFRATRGCTREGGCAVQWKTRPCTTGQTSLLAQAPAGQPSPSPLLPIEPSGQPAASQPARSSTAADRHNQVLAQLQISPPAAAGHTLTRAGSSSTTRSITSESAASSPRLSTSVSWPRRPPLAAATIRLTSAAGAREAQGHTRHSAQQAQQAQQQAQQQAAKKGMVGVNSGLACGAAVQQQDSSSQLQPPGGRATG